MSNISLSPIDFIAASFAAGKEPDLYNCGWSTEAVFETLQSAKQMGKPWAELMAKRITELSGGTVQVTIADGRGPYKSPSLVLQAVYPDSTRMIVIGAGMNAVRFLD